MKPWVQPPVLDKLGMIISLALTGRGRKAREGHPGLREILHQKTKPRRAGKAAQQLRAPAIFPEYPGSNP